LTKTPPPQLRNVPYVGPAWILLLRLFCPRVIG